MAIDTVEHLVEGVSLTETFVGQTLAGPAESCCDLARTLLASDEAERVVHDLEHRAADRPDDRRLGFMRELRALLVTFATGSLLAEERDALLVSVASTEGNGQLFTNLATADARAAMRRAARPLIVCDFRERSTLRVLRPDASVPMALCADERARLNVVPAPPPTPPDGRAALQERLGLLSAAVAASGW